MANNSNPSGRAPSADLSPMHYPPHSLRAALRHEPRVLKFGTSGRRGEVAHLTQLEIYLNARAEIEYLQSLPRDQGGIAPGEPFYFAADLRPSSTRYLPEHGGRGELAQAIVRALIDTGMRPVNLGFLPTPALTAHALSRGCGSMMITGSHIPFDRNGYKTNSAQGELLKRDEAPINRRVESLRQRLYAEPFATSLFDEEGRFKQGHTDLPPAIDDARAGYIRRYVDFFGGDFLRGIRLLAYQHSAVGRDLLVEVLSALGGEVLPVGRSEVFIPIDTENLEPAQLTAIQELAVESWRSWGPFDAVVSTDGDSDRPLVLGVGPTPGAAAPCQARFYSGDLLGMVVAEWLRADAVVVPITCNDAIDRGPLRAVLEPRTRIGSPEVIAGIEAARRKGRQAVCGWEPNGGFLLGSDFVRNGRTLRALPTRDAVLPILGVLGASKAHGLSLGRLFARLPQRYGKAALLKNFPQAEGRQLVARYLPPDPRVIHVLFQPEGVVCQDVAGGDLGGLAGWHPEAVREALSPFFPVEHGFASIARFNYVDGLRLGFANGEIVHVRPSGNADELRIYAVADTLERVEQIVALGIAEPDGILRRMARGL